jgi:N6-adenosine-specific RNA methylase IME4
MYRIIYVDPPWFYDDKASAGKRGACYKYPTMTTQEICALRVKKIAEKDCFLFLWITAPKIFDAQRVIKAWGFTYKTFAFVWIKTNKKYNTEQFSFLPVNSFDSFMGMGNYTRANAEVCLLAARGKPKRINADVEQVIYSPVERHSKKPDEARKRIIRLCGDLPKIELFARQKTPGWDAWGNEIKKDVAL